MVSFFLQITEKKIELINIRGEVIGRVGTILNCGWGLIDIRFFRIFLKETGPHNHFFTTTIVL